MNTVAQAFDDQHRETYIQVQMRGLDCKSSWVRDDASQIAKYVSSLIATRSHDSDRDDTVRGSISAARLALTEALLAVRLAEEEFNKSAKQKLKVA